MNKYDFILERFPDIKISENKIIVEHNLADLLKYLKSNPELSYDTLFSIIAIDYLEYIELIYVLVSTYLNETINVSINVTNETESVTHIYTSAYFDECEIFDMFGIRFNNNKNLKRLFMPKSWVGNPLRKNYQLNDERLMWNEQ